MANLDGVKLVKCANINWKTFKLIDNRRVSLGQIDNGNFSIKIRRLRDANEIQGSTWEDKIAEIKFCISAEAFAALFHLSFEIYKEKHGVLDNLLTQNIKVLS